VRHWLPSQGVDPAPLAELNSECLGQLVAKAAEGDANTCMPVLLSSLRAQWATLPAHAVRRLAAAPFSLFDAGFASAPRWLELRTRGVNELPQRVEPAFFPPDMARAITRRMLVYGWHLARSRPRAACMVFGSTLAGVESLAACSLVSLEAAADRNAEALRPRWSNQVGFWRSCCSRRQRALTSACTNYFSEVSSALLRKHSQRMLPDRVARAARR
jgi:hypothetical protein